jgi:hypothetical protein
MNGVNLVAPTTFPKPPAGTTGILVFPFTSASLGTPSGAAVPTPDWDNPPANFFNDFGSCSGKTNDCYRSETYPAPLLALETSEARTVGFDVDKNSQTVVAYLVVAADIRDVVLQTVTILGDSPSCGTISSDLSTGLLVFPGDTLIVGIPPAGNVLRGACSFILPPSLAHITGATLRVFQDLVAGDPFSPANAVVVDHVDYGAQLTGSVFDQPALAADIGAISTDVTPGYKSLLVTSSVRDDLQNGRPASQFRLRFSVDPAAGLTAGFNYLGHHPAELVITYQTP